MTERFEITSILQRELVNAPAVFGEIVPGSEAEPAVYMESVHHLLKLVAGVPNLRPAWFFDVTEQGEALADVGTHLVDLAQWTLFPGAALDYRKDLKVLSASRWPTTMTAEQFKQVTGQPVPALDYYCNTRVTYALRGIHIKFDVLWNWEAPAGGGDTHFAIYRGTKSRVEVRQSAKEKYVPELFVVGDVGKPLQAKVAELVKQYPGIDVEDHGGEFRVTIPERLPGRPRSPFWAGGAGLLRLPERTLDLPGMGEPGHAGEILRQHEGHRGQPAIARRISPICSAWRRGCAAIMSSIS